MIRDPRRPLSYIVRRAGAVAAGDGGGGLVAFNAAFEPARTPFDWLSRDAAQVELSIADP